MDLSASVALSPGPNQARRRAGWLCRSAGANSAATELAHRPRCWRKCCDAAQAAARERAGAPARTPGAFAHASACRIAQPLHCLSGGQDGEAFKCPQHQQVLITRDNQIRPHCQCAGQNCVVVRVAANGLWQGGGNDQIADQANLFNRIGSRQTALGKKPFRCVGSSTPASIPQPTRRKWSKTTRERAPAQLPGAVRRSTPALRPRCWCQ